MLHLKPCVAIIGAGNVGIRYAYALMLRGIARQIIIVDRNKQRTEGEVMDLSHATPYVAPVEIVVGEMTDIENADLVVITAGVKQTPNQRRTDLAKDNVELFKKLIPEIIKYAPQAILLVVTNPVDILSYATYKISGKPSGEVIGSGTVLDSARLKFLIAQHCHIDAHNVHAYVLGEHGDTEFAVWSKAMIGGIMISEYYPLCHRSHTCEHDMSLQNIFNEVKNSAYDIIKRKGETSYGIGLALVTISRAILKDEHAVLPVSSLVNGYLGVKDMYLSLPAVLHKHGVLNVLEIDLSEQEKKQCVESATAIKKLISQCGF